MISLQQLKQSILDFGPTKVLLYDGSKIFLKAPAHENKFMASLCEYDDSNTWFKIDYDEIKEILE